MKIFVSTHPFGSVSSDPLDLLSRVGLELRLNPHGRKIKQEELIAELADVDALIAGTESLNREVLLSAPKLKMIARVGIGVDGIDFSVTRERGILVTYTPEAVTHAVAELTVGLMLNLARSTHLIHQNMKQGVWDRVIGFELQGKKIGLVGFGRVGRRVARLLRGFNCRILAYDTAPDEEAASQVNVQLRPLDEILQSCDIISLHVPKTAITHNMIDGAWLSRMKKSAMLINTSRGGIVNENDLYVALKNGVIAAAALDVYELEPYVAGRLCELDNLLMTAHSGSCSREARSQMETGAAEEVRRFAAGEAPLFPVPEETMAMENNRKVVPINADWHELSNKAVENTTDAYKLYRQRWGQYPSHRIVAPMPFNIDIELVCNPGDPDAPMINRYLSPPGRDSHFMDEKLFRSLMDEVRSCAEPVAVKLGFRGDPLQHPKIGHFIKLAHAAGSVETILSTRAAGLDDRKIRELIDGGLDVINIYVEISLTKQYRKLIEICEIINKIKLMRILSSSDTPRVRVMSDVDMDDAAEMEKFKNFWRHWADIVTVMDIKDTSSLPSLPANLEWSCSRLWQRLVVTHAGKILVCNYDLDETSSLGNFPSMSIRKAWTSAGFQHMRDQHTQNHSGAVIPCSTCLFRACELSKYARS